MIFRIPEIFYIWLVNIEHKNFLINNAYDVFYRIWFDLY